MVCNGGYTTTRILYSLNLGVTLLWTLCQDEEAADLSAVELLMLEILAVAV
jgi:hypothetical protein